VTEWTAPEAVPRRGRVRPLRLDRAGRPSQPVNFIVHRGDTKDGTDADRRSTRASPRGLAEAGRPDHLHQPGGGAGLRHHPLPATRRRLRRPDLADFDDYWGLHLWGDAIDPAEATDWTDAQAADGHRRLRRLLGGRRCRPDATLPVNFIIHRGDDEGPRPRPVDDPGRRRVDLAAVGRRDHPPTRAPPRGTPPSTTTARRRLRRPHQRRLQRLLGPARLGRERPRPTRRGPIR
jgi:hypothetical protein